MERLNMWFPIRFYAYVHFLRYSFILIILSTLLISCTTLPQDLYVDISEVHKKQLTFIEDGRTSKEDVYLKLGIPSGQFNNNTILAYRLTMGKDEQLTPVSQERDITLPYAYQWRLANFTLVLVFDEQDILTKHSLIRVK
jgi:hypothetical protein